MEFIFWNVNNNAKAIELIDSIDFTEQKRVFAISEFWSIKEKFEGLSTDKIAWHDEINGRTGVIYSKSIKLTPYGGERYFSIYKMQHKGMDLLLAVVHLKSMLRSESASNSINLNVIKNMLVKLNPLKNQNIIIMGDFNQSFCNEITDIYHLNATNYYYNNEKHHKTYFSPCSSYNNQPYGTLFFT